MEIPLNGRLWEIRLPDYPVKLDIMAANSSNENRARMAALGLCLVEVGSPKGKPVKFYPNLSYLACGCNALVYGGAITAEGYRRRIPTAEMGDAAQLCIEAVAEAFEVIESPPAPEELKAAEDFTGHPGASGP